MNRKIILYTLLILMLFPVVHANVTVPDHVNLGIPDQETYISFDGVAVVSDLYREGDFWFFDDLNFDAVLSDIEVSVLDADISFSAVDLETWMNYTTGGAGTQILVIGSDPTTVYLDGADVIEGVGWNYTGDTLTVYGATSDVRVNFGASVYAARGELLAAALVASLILIPLLILIIFAARRKR